MRESDSLTLDGGRVLSYAIYGSPVPHTSVFYFHSFASSRKEAKIWHTAAAKLGVRLVAPDRPGLGNSSFQPSRTFLDWPKDVIALADHLKIQTFYVMGWSGGVIGNAARNPDPKVYEETLTKAIDGRPEIDKRAMMDEKNWPGFCEGTREGLRQGGQGTGVENKLNGSSWGFELAELKVGEGGVPLTLWHGTEDINCPATMTLKAKQLLPGAKLNMLKGEGHASIAFNHQEEVLSELIGATDN
ncbi:uncharacterized protein N0V89_008398 [Didymosphaeria variabile]|uniref:AB hydrolase-1 domain-containing protein n=1 Tax=Didymosphaeria variabile TaxID=1932322 RepID=A0A9W8XG77_9PLEO|nr:uncharacterized protein N0V89_008398 [Didymosphaeria variabile]KAJ4349780.1 hypothetical protein N0V89_008398 [Didymosphaeria variabile]